MPNNTQLNRQRLIDMLMDSYPEGIKTSEIAESLEVTQQTARNYLDRLNEDGILVYELEENGRYTLDRRDYVRPLNLSLAQAWFLYLPLRRIVRANLNRFPLVNTLLLRIAKALHGELAAQLVSSESPTHSVDDVFSMLVDAWRDETYVEIRYRRLDASSTVTHRIEPWWFEPAVWSDSNYLIAGRKAGGEVKPMIFKLDRIESVRKLNARFQRPPADMFLKRVKETWGIWVSDGEAVRVVLRFQNRVHDRLYETRWHPTQEIRIDKDSSLLWEAVISEPQEMMPWIRGWGADVEVLEPQPLRDDIAAEAERTARLYGKGTGEPRSFF
jgi:CRISPR-associated endonuclease/helicase Cas3